MTLYMTCYICKKKIPLILEFNHLAKHTKLELIEYIMDKEFMVKPVRSTEQEIEKENKS